MSFYIIFNGINNRLSFNCIVYCDMRALEEGTKVIFISLFSVSTILNAII